MKNFDFWRQSSQVCTGAKLKEYFLEHATYTWKGFYKVEKPLHVFKKAMRNYTPVIVALTIPEGADVYAPGCAWAEDSDAIDRKMRASAAVVHSRWSLLTRSRLSKDSKVVSTYQSDFPYPEGAVVIPDYFSTERKQCAGGIHFFLNFYDAYYYR